MSYTTMLLFPASGPPRDHAEYPNAHRAHPLIWSAFAERFAGDRGACDPMKIRKGSEVTKFWELDKDPTIPRVYRLVLQMTWDHALVRRADLLMMADALDTFISDLPLEFGAGHLLAWTKEFRALAGRDDFVAVGFIGTSVADDVWRVRSEDSDECRDYDLSRDTDHYFVGDGVPEDSGVHVNDEPITMPPRKP